MNKLPTLILCALLAFAGNAYAADGLRIADFSIAQGETKTVSVDLDNAENSYILLEFTMQLPEGISIDTDENGELLIEWNEARFTRTHVMDVSYLGNNQYKFLIYSNKNAVIKDNSGELFSMTITADVNAPNGVKQGGVHDQIFAIDEDTEYDPADSYFNITILKGGLLGDVNSDSKVTIADVTALVNIILGKDDGPNPVYDHNAANVNGDTKVTIADVTALVNLILGKN